MSRLEAPVRDRRPHNASGQILVLFTLALVGLLAMAGLVIEGGNLLGQQRIAQNGADAAANAGAIVIAENLSGGNRTGQDVLDAVSGIASANGLEAPQAEYTDGFGKLLGIPVSTGAIPPAARGVNVGGNRTVATSLIRVVGITELTAAADATAAAGVLSQSGPGTLPITFPVQISNCDESAYYHPGTAVWPVVDANARTTGNMVTVPLCAVSNGASSIGWLDFGQPNLMKAIEDGPVEPIPIPAWLHTKTGVNDAGPLEDAFNALANSPVLIPMFDDTCVTDPGDGYAKCVNPVPPHGSGNYYHIPYFMSFYIYQAYTNGNDVATCSSAPGTPETISDSNRPGFLGCIKGWFVEYVYDGPIDPNREITSDATIGIQLIK